MDSRQISKKAIELMSSVGKLTSEKYSLNEVLKSVAHLTQGSLDSYLLSVLTRLFMCVNKKFNYFKIQSLILHKCSELDTRLAWYDLFLKNTYCPFFMTPEWNCPFLVNNCLLVAEVKLGWLSSFFTSFSG